MPKKVAQAKEVAHWGTVITTAVLIVVGFFFYWLSTWSTLNIVRSSRRLADVTKRTVARKGDDAAVQDALLLELSKLEHRNDLGELFLHISIAFFVAVVIVIADELEFQKARSVPRERIFAGVAVLR